MALQFLGESLLTISAVGRWGGRWTDGLGAAQDKAVAPKTAHHAPRKSESDSLYSTRQSIVQQVTVLLVRQFVSREP